MRVFAFLICLLLFTSCEYFTFSKSNNLVAIDTVVDFSTVDMSPSFKSCDAIVNKIEKSNCFRSEIHKKISEQISQFSLTIKDSLDEVVFVDLLINSKGEFVLDSIISSEKTKKQLPQLDSLLKESVLKLPVILPARKHGMRVTTKYRLPIKLQLKE